MASVNIRPFVGKTQRVLLPKKYFRTRRLARSWLRSQPIPYRADIIEDSGKTQAGEFWIARQFAPTRGLAKVNKRIGHHGVLLTLELWPRSAVGHSNGDQSEEGNRGRPRRPTGSSGGMMRATKRAPTERYVPLMLGGAGLLGVAAGSRLDNFVQARPLGQRPSVIAIVAGLAGAFVASQYRYPTGRLRYPRLVGVLAASSVGIGVGALGNAILKARGGR